MLRPEFLSAVREKIVPVPVVLDVGAGIKPQKFYRPAVHIIIEPYLPYIQALQKAGFAAVYLCSTWDRAMSLLPADSVDTVFALDVIEHLKKSEGMHFIQQAERVARKQIVITTPLGAYPQQYGEDKLDRWGFQGGYWQEHRSAWTPDDFGGWEIFVCEDFHKVDQHEQELIEPIGAFYAIKTKGKE